MKSVPEKMKAFLATAPAPKEALADPAELAQYLAVSSIDVPNPGAGEVLIKVSRGTINPNDLYHVKGEYSSTRDLDFPRALGFEGAGVVVAAGPGLIGRIRMGSRVAFYALGMFGEYVVCKALDLIVIPKHVDFQTAACSVANPMTSLSMLQVVSQCGSPAFINTAAASALGRLMIRHSRSRGLTMICVVRREEQAEICRQEGAEYVLNSSNADFDQELKALCEKTACRLAFDCVAGDMPERLLNALPDDGVVKLYGYLTPGNVEFKPQSLFPERKLETFEVNEHLARLSLYAKFRMSQAITSGMGKAFGSEVQKSYSLDQGVQAYAHYSQNMTAGKVQIIADSAL